ncbi:MAG TPA: PfkB family carbohydrate kinase [Solirubrobacterales bacterium]
MTVPAKGLAVVGAINVDLVVSSERLPRAGETVVGEGPRSFGGGKGANAAVAAARAGAEVVLVGAVGDDPTGTETLDLLIADGVDVAGVARLAGEPTGVALIVVDAAGENQIAVGAGANGALDGATVRAALEPRIAGLGCVLVSTEIPDEAVLAAVDLAAAAGLPCVLNPAPPTRAVERSVPRGAILTPNAGELRDLLGRLGEPVGPGIGEDAGALARLSGAPVIVTRGGDGVLVAGGEETFELPAPAAEVVDTTGAGDTFNGVLAARLAAGDELRRAAQLAVAAASISVGKQGAREGMPTAGEITAAVSA